MVRLVSKGRHQLAMSAGLVEHLALLEAGSLARLSGAPAEAVRMAQTAVEAGVVEQEPLELLATIPQAAMEAIRHLERVPHKGTV